MCLPVRVAVRACVAQSIQKLHLEIDEDLRRRPFYTLFFLPVLLDSICSTAQNLFRKYYPKWFASRMAPATDAQIVAIVDKSDWFPLPLHCVHRQHWLC